MPAYDYTRAKATADRLIARYGQTGMLRRPTSVGPEHDPLPGASVYHEVTFAVMNYANGEIDGTRIMASDKRVYLSSPIEPLTSDELLIGGHAHKVAAVMPLSPGGTVVYYELQVRR